MNIILLIVGFYMLIKCADIFVESSSNIAKALKIPSIIIGLTIVGLGTSAPEAAVSVIAAINGNYEVATGNVIGSNICNLLLVLGLSGIFGTLKVKRKIIFRDYIYLIFSYIILIIMIGESFIVGSNFAVITRVNALILLCFLVIYLYFLMLDTRGSLIKESSIKFKLSYIIDVIISLLGIVFGGKLVVNSSINIASILGVNDDIIALTIVAIGTSLPELITSAIATKKGENDIAIGNVLGSNIFNILFIIGISSFINPMIIDFNTFIDIIIMFITGLIVFILLLKDKKITLYKSIVMLIIYFSYITYLILR
ncbi:MAG: calcium/sodium antiporter [Bacilli bacterium]|nr:calcium/sodium antiporter [Bacilli bacterium]